VDAGNVSAAQAGWGVGCVSSCRQMPVSQCFNASAEGEDAANYPGIRIMSLYLNDSTVPLKDISAPELPWSVSSKQAVLGNMDWDYFSATCYFYGRELYKELKVGDMHKTSRA
jgi:sialate O-acetylesterase